MIKRRQLMWGVTALAVLAMVLLAAGLEQLELYPEDRPFTLGALLVWLWQQYVENTEMLVPETMPSTDNLIVLVRIFFAMALVLFPLSIVLLIISPEFRKRALRELLRLIIFLAAVQALVKVRFLDGEPLFNLEDGERLPAFDFPALSETDLAYDQRPSRSVIYAVSLLIALVIAYAVVLIGWRVVRRRRDQAMPLQRLAQEAQHAVEALRAEGDVGDIVTRCYAEMSRIVQEERGLQREDAVTAREFERYLGQQNLPAEPVHTLTRLFEAVRYGAKVPGEMERQQAIESLSVIAEACRSVT